MAQCLHLLHHSSLCYCACAAVQCEQCRRGLPPGLAWPPPPASQLSAQSVARLYVYRINFNNVRTGYPYSVLATATVQYSAPLAVVSTVLTKIKIIRAQGTSL